MEKARVSTDDDDIGRKVRWKKEGLMSLVRYRVAESSMYF